MTDTQLSPKASNAAFFGLLEKGMTKQAADMVTDFTRVKIRESSFFEKLMPAVKIGNEELTPQLDTDKNVKLVEREPGSPAAVTVPLGAQPIQYYIKGDRYPVFFDRILTPKFTKDMSELRTYGMDIRQVISDNAILDMDFEFDQKMLTAVQSIIGSEGSTVPATGVIQNLVIVDPAGITRNSLFEIKKILPQTFAHLPLATILCNVITIEDIAKFGRDEVGGDMSQEMFEQGFQQKKLLGINWVVTNKVELVEASEFYGFASPEFIGKSFVLEDTTMFVEKRAFNLEFFAYCERGATIGNVASVCRARITSTD
jgi:hypothetical protein